MHFPTRRFSVAPSVFATEPHGRVTDRYGFVPTIDLVEAIEQEGWFPVTVRQSRVRDETRHGFQRHMLRFRQEQPTQVGDSVTELVLLNSRRQLVVPARPGAVPPGLQQWHGDPDRQGRRHALSPRPRGRQLGDRGRLRPGRRETRSSPSGSTDSAA